MTDILAPSSSPRSLLVFALLAACAARAAPDSTTPVAAVRAPPTVALPNAPVRISARAVAAALEGHGRWIDSPGYGPAWIPEVAGDSSWAPYVSRGRWVATEAGWFWRSDDAWGAVTFHYGRWAQLDGSWAWLPGAAFAPAWVEWRTGNGWVGWSPIGPQGDAERAPFTYTAAGGLAGEGLASRVVQGAAAVSLFALTQPHTTPSLGAARPLLDVWRASLPTLGETNLSMDGEVIARLTLPDAPSVRAEEPVASRARLLGTSFDVARASVAPRVRSSDRAAPYAPVHMPPPVEDWPAPGSFRFGALRAASPSASASTALSTPVEVFALTPGFSGSTSAPAVPVQTSSTTGGVGISTPPPVSTQSSSPSLIAQ